MDIPFVDGSTKIRYVRSDSSGDGKGRDVRTNN